MWRRGALLVRVLMALPLALAAVYCAARGLDATFGAGSRLQRLQAEAPPDGVRTAGVVRATSSAEPPLCSVTHQRWLPCGKSMCWTRVAGMLTADGEFEKDDGAHLELGADFRFVPEEPGDERWSREVLGARAVALRARGRQSGLAGFGAQDFPRSGNDRLVERCLDDGERVFVQGCVRPTPTGTRLAPCPGDASWTVVPGDGTPQAAVDEAANDALYWVGAAFGALLALGIVLFPRGQKLAESLERRCGHRSPARRWAYAVLVLPCVVLIASLVERATQPPTSTWAYGRGGYAVAAAVAVGLGLVALASVRRRSVLRHAMQPVLGTPRSLLGNARGATVELAVHTATAPTTTSVLEGGGSALSILGVDEVFSVGKRTETRSVHQSYQPRELTVSDESGEGRLDLGHVLVDGEVRTRRLTEWTDTLTRRTGPLDRHPSHICYVVTEQVLRPGELLYVLGEVIDVQMRGSEQGYRAVRGAPTLGGAEAPLVIYAGTERGLLGELQAERVGLGVLLAVALGSLALLGGATAWLAAQ